MAPASLATDAKRGRILGAARRLLVRQGFQDIVLDHVAREAGVAKGTLFLYFRNKEELFSAAFAELVDQLGESLDGLIASGKDGGELLEATVRVVLDYFERNQDFLSLFGAGRFPGCGARSSGRLMDRFSANLKRMVRILRRCGVGGRDIEFAAVALFGLCRSANVHRALSGDARPLSGRTGRIVDWFLRGAEGGR